MSKMCKLGEECTSHSGLCIHEKMMMGMMMLVVVGLAGRFVFHWF